MAEINHVSRETLSKKIVAILADYLICVDQPKIIKAKIILYIDLLRDWSAKINLTTITEPLDILYKHFLDSLQLLPFLQQEKPLYIADFGSGAGFPGIALALFYPSADFFLLEATAKKIQFLEIVKKRLEITNLIIKQVRVEDFYQDSSHHNFFDLIIARSFAYLPIFLELGFGFLQAKGFLVAYKSAKNLHQEIQAAQEFIRKHNLVFCQKYTYNILGDARGLCFFQKKAIIPNYKIRNLKKLKNIYKLQGGKN